MRCRAEAALRPGVVGGGAEARPLHRRGARAAGGIGTGAEQTASSWPRVGAAVLYATSRATRGAISMVRTGQRVGGHRVADGRSGSSPRFRHLTAYKHIRSVKMEYGLKADSDTKACSIPSMCTDRLGYGIIRGVSQVHRISQNEHTVGVCSQRDCLIELSGKRFRPFAASIAG
jgi:hypothetical protein